MSKRQEWRRVRPGELEPVVLVGTCHHCGNREVVWVVDKGSSFWVARPGREDLHSESARPAIESARQSGHRWTAPVDRSQHRLKSGRLEGECPKHGTVAADVDLARLQRGRTQRVHLRRPTDG